MSVSICRQNLEDAIIDGQERNIEGATTEIEDENVLLSLFLIQTISNGSSSPWKQTKIQHEQKQ